MNFSMSIATRVTMKIRTIALLLNVASNWLLHDKVANHNLLENVKFLLDCILLKIEASSAAGGSAFRLLHWDLPIVETPFQNSWIRHCVSVTHDTYS